MNLTQEQMLLLTTCPYQDMPKLFPQYSRPELRAKRRALMERKWKAANPKKKYACETTRADGDAIGRCSEREKFDRDAIAGSAELRIAILQALLNQAIRDAA